MTARDEAKRHLEMALNVMLESLEASQQVEPCQSDAIDHVRAAIDCLSEDQDPVEAVQEKL